MSWRGRDLINGGLLQAKRFHVTFLLREKLVVLRNVPRMHPRRVQLGAEEYSTALPIHGVKTELVPDRWLFGLAFSFPDNGFESAGSFPCGRRTRSVTFTKSSGRSEKE